MPNARSRPKVASLTVSDLFSVLLGLRDNGVRPQISFSVIARSQRVRPPAGPMINSATKQSILLARIDGLLRFPRNEGLIKTHHAAVPFIVGWPAEFAVHNSMPPLVSLALIENSLP